MTKKTSKDESLAWAKKAYAKLKDKQDIKFRSGLEEKVADLLSELGVSYEYESKRIPYVIQHHYTPDFVLFNNVILECKGYWDPADRRKIKTIKKANPDLDLRMVFQAPFNTISRKSKTTYAQWCENLGIPWTSFNNIPLDWLL
tara:strand:- start:236 stop:667 length:432 start_codon:yes stop_codon:yes gene_type:complete